MMQDDLFDRDRHGEGSRELPDRPAEPQAPLADREVPLSPIAPSDVIHRWLDGELPEPTGVRGDAARSVEFWRRIGEETARRRRVATPAYLPARIMAALPSPDAAPAVVPWWKRNVQLTTSLAIALALAAFALGMLLMRAVGAK